MSSSTRLQRPVAEDDAFIKAVYRSLLGRDPDLPGLKLHRTRLQNGESDWEAMLTDFLRSEEFRITFARVYHVETLHRARELLFRRHIPAARRILDLGGAAENNPEGGLFTLGYPHSPELLTIVDLPPDERFSGPESAEQTRSLCAARGTRVEYVHCSMADLDFAADASYDLIVSGESIEHVTEADADRIIAHAFRILEPGGSFCLDTPNAGAARLQSPAVLLHPEHKKEYLPSELRKKLTDAGFRIEQELGLCPMPESLRQGRFLWTELFLPEQINARPEEGYLFFLHARKPA